MRNEIKITHQQIIEYLCDRIDPETEAYISESKKADPVYHLFFELIDELKSHATIKEHQKARTGVRLTFSMIENMLMRILAGDIQPAEAQQIINELIGSPLFYQRLLAKMASATPEIALENVPEIEQVQIKLDDELLEIIENETRREKEKIPSVKAKIKRLLRLFPDISKSLQRPFEIPQRLPRFAYVVPVIIVGIFLTFITYDKIIKKDDFQYYVYDDKVPCEYNMSSLRNAEDILKDDPLFRSFVNQFKLGMSNYVVRDYSNAIHNFQILQSYASELLSKSPSEIVLPWIRDLYFYLGVSYLAISRSKLLDLKHEDRKRQSIHAIQSLALADSLVTVHRLQTYDRESYFLGLAYGFGGYKDSAIARLGKIKRESQFYNDSNKLIGLWSK